MSGALFLSLFLITNGAQLYLNNISHKSWSSDVICLRLHRAAGDESTGKQAWDSNQVLRSHSVISCFTLCARFYPMKTHLPEHLCFVYQLTIYVQPQQKETAEYAANITKIAFDYFEKYFGMEYSLPKLGEKMLFFSSFQVAFVFICLFYLS